MFDVTYLPEGTTLTVFATAVVKNNLDDETLFLVWDERWRWFPAELCEPVEETHKKSKPVVVGPEEMNMFPKFGTRGRNK